MALAAALLALAAVGDPTQQQHDGYVIQTTTQPFGAAVTAGLINKVLQRPAASRHTQAKSPAEALMPALLVIYCRFLSSWTLLF